MVSIYDVKPKFQALLRPTTRALARAGITANLVTVAAMLASIGVGLCIYLWPAERWPLFVLPAFLFVRMAFNAIDGMLAREHGQQSSLGAVLNELTDVVSDAALYLPLAVIPGMPAPWIVLAVVLAGLTEMTGVVGVQIGASRRYDGPMGKSDRAFLIGLQVLMMAVGTGPNRWTLWWYVVIDLALAWTCFRRARAALAELSE